MTIAQAYDLAVRRHQAGRLADADALYRQILAAQPGHAGALHLRGLIAHQLGRHDLAVQWIRQSIALDSNNAIAYSNLGEVCRALGRFDEAVPAFRHALELKPDYPDAHNNLGAALATIGQLDEATAAFHRAVELKPDYPEAWNNLGIALRRRGQIHDAVAAYRRAVEYQPDFPAAHNNLGIVLSEQGQLPGAVAALRRAIELQPGYSQAHYNLGNALKDLGRLGDAIAEYRRALQTEPDFPAALLNLGAALAECGQFDEAIAEYRRADQLSPDSPVVHNNLGNALRETGRFDEAVDACRRALELSPDFPDASLNLGAALAARGQFDEAIASYQRALELRPDYPEAHNNQGAALRDLCRLDEAIAEHRRALEIKPDYPEAQNNLGNALRDRGQFEEAVAAYRRALQIKPDYPDAHNNLGAALAELGQPDAAIAAYRRALEIKPDHTEAHNNLGNALKDQGQLDEAITVYRRALELNPNHALVHSNLVYALHFLPGSNESAIAKERERWNQQFSEPLKRFLAPHANHRSPERRLRIGYVSPDFRDHVIGRNLLPLLKRHDSQNLELLCYSGAVRLDKLTEEFRQRAEGWRSTVGVGDEALAEMIRRDGVDILVDLTQHMAGNRLSVFARKPAPVQVSFAGYPGSPGVDAVEYRISDRYLEAAPANERTGNKEQVCLIDSFWCYDPCGMELEINPPPSLENRTMTFGCLNNFSKINAQALRLWARVLGSVTGSRLVLLAPEGSHRQRTLEALESEGVEAHRVEFAKHRPRREYLELYHRLDIVLDTFPYNGHTTTCDALWMGVPVVSLAGEIPVSRAGLSLLTNLGLPELVAHSETEYVNIAESLANDLPRLAQLRANLRNRMETSILMDAPRFARNIEAAYRSMWERWCANPSSLHRD